MWRRAPCLEISRCAATSPSEACSRIFRKARIVSRLESTTGFYEFLNSRVEILRVDRLLLLAARGLRAFGFGFSAVLIGVHLEHRGPDRNARCGQRRPRAVRVGRAGGAD